MLAKDRRVIPVVRRLMADGDPGRGRKLAKDAPAFLLESAEHGGVWSRYSIVGVACRATLTERDGEAVWVGEPPWSVPTEGNPVEALRDTVATTATEPIEACPRSPAAWWAPSATTRCAVGGGCPTRTPTSGASPRSR